MKTLHSLLTRLPGVIAFLCLMSLPAFASGDAQLVEPEPVMIAPFIILLLAIAVMPFINGKWWHHYFPHVSIGLGLITVLYYLFILGNPHRMLESGIEYASFICLIGSLFVASGGVHIKLKGYATPFKNVIILLFGAVISNIVGTTGASMILIRPYLQNNKSRLHAYHIVFFIFIVSNIGGALTPIGDPPLFLGYLQGIPFFWVVEEVWHIWLLQIGMIIAVFIAIDYYYYMKVPKSIREMQHGATDSTKIQGLHNLGFIIIILVAVFIQNPPFVREAIMIAAAIGSYFTTRESIHKANDFSFFPIKEVGFLFLGLFATMTPALDWLELNASSLGVQHVGQFYWGAGLLSSFLDNAPTYLNFLSTEIGLLVTPEIITGIQNLVTSGGTALANQPMEVQATYETIVRYHSDLINSGVVPTNVIDVSYLITAHARYVVAISIASVFFGAMTYIGNAPNFMVKSIAEQSGAKMPSFFGYLFKFSIPILLPMFVLVWYLFFRG